MTNGILFELIVLLLLLMLSGFFSSAETALFSISKVKARHLAKGDLRTDRLISRMKEDPHRLLTTILIGNNLVNIGAASLATVVAIRVFPGNTVGIVTGAMTVVILIFGEIIPKSVATRNNLMLARFVIYPVFWLSVLFFPAIYFLNFIPRLTGKMSRTPAATQEELKTFVEVVEEEGQINEEEREWIHNVIEFDDISASEIMTSRRDMVVVEADEPMDLQTILASGHSRFPVIDGGSDNVIGILHLRDIFQHQLTGESAPAVRQLMVPPFFVPANKKIDALLCQFKRRKQHMAVVIDEYGGVDGLITLEDVLEEIVGEISDETDREENLIVRLAPDEWRVLGKTEIDDINDAIPMQIPESKKYDTFSGYVLDQIKRIPDIDEVIELPNFTVTVLRREGNRILEYHVKQTA
jgi:putative hemolysin